MRPLWIALGLLSRIPAPLAGAAPTAREMGLSVLCYPLVGLVLGGLLAGLAWGLERVAVPTVAAGWTLIAWVWLTGGLHLDGLADTADGWIGGLGDRERGLAIMRDPHSGPAAVVAVTLVLLLKFAALQVLFERREILVFLLPLFIARVGLVAMFLRLPYLRASGMGALAAGAVPRAGGWMVVLGCALGVVEAWGMTGVVALLCGGVAWWGVRAGLLRRFGGFTGDTAGAMCEILEAVVLTGLTMA
ncbi:MAG: adenosylcobinamide-GDP ribazoletransferase [Magnetococcales bacterium]|nr:adenosylcobinamide-GDP ribazoletransferase [Magnetococcales bacterium]